jgi:predicted acyltransferase (DUF342 family)
MKTIISLCLCCCFFFQFIQAQNVPGGMKYQAIARDLDGQIMANKQVVLKINLHSDNQAQEADYIELHAVKTNQFGLFDLVIGNGRVEAGSFEAIPWSTHDIFMAISIRDEVSKAFITISDSKLLAVPYAFHAATASELVETAHNGRSTFNTNPDKHWSVFGNEGTSSSINKLGTTDKADLVIVTADQERMRITNPGNIKIANELTVAGDALYKSNFYVERNVDLNTSEGRTNVYGSLSVLRNAPTRLSGTLNVDGYARINNTLSVTNNAPTYLSGTADVGSDLTVGGKTNLKDALLVGNSAPTYLTGILLVNGLANFRNDVLAESKLTVDGQTTLNNSLTVTNMSPTLLSGRLDIEQELQVNGTTTLNDDFTVENQSMTHLSGDLVVEGVAEFGKELSVAGALNLQDSLTVLNQAPTYFTGKLDVEGETSINNAVEIVGSLDLIHDSNGYIATLSNTNDGNGDGLKISLGKTHPRWNGNGEVALTFPGQAFLESTVTTTADLVSNLISTGDFDLQDLEPLGVELANIVTDLYSNFDFVAATACNVTKDIIVGLNDEILPVSIPRIRLPKVGVGGDITIPFPTGDVDISVPDLSVGPHTLLSARNLVNELPVPTCDAVPPLNNTFDLPNIQFVDVNNSLTSDNKFIQFTDMENRQLGAIEAQSIREWGNSYLNAPFFLNLFNSFAGVTVIGIDPTQIAETAGKYIINGIAQFSNIINDYNTIGVQYNSGFGDYAEWLERAEQDEFISAGDIVGVSGGKISKNLDGAEQIMAVSTNPIVLGNAPDEENAHLGNKVAFMGQIPVKILGPVTTGDFIVANSEIPGYGIAIHPTDMTVDDYALVVGRSWETIELEGPKMVNTVIGVHNGSMINIMKEYVEKQKETDARLSSIEERLSTLLPIANN